MISIYEWCWLDGETAAVNSIGDRYRDLLRCSRPELTFDEWEAIVDQNNGCWAAAFSREVPRIELITDEMAEKHSVDAAALNSVLAALDCAGRLAVLDVIERTWAHPGKPLESLRAALDAEVKQ